MPEFAPPRLAVILATDCYETIPPVVQHLRRQTIRDQLEIVIVGQRAGSLGLDDSELEGFARVAVVEVESLLPIGPARAAGGPAAQAPLVFIGETNTYAHPTWAETMIQAHGNSWAGVVELTRHLAAVASGRAFPTHALSDAVVRRAAETHSLDRHSERLRRIFTTLAAPPVATRSAPPPALLV